MTGARREVLSNPDLVRHIISQSRDAARLLVTSKELLSSQQECTPHILRWARDGCAPPQTDEERRCLDAVGGVDGAFCTELIYEVTRDGTKRRVDAKRLAQHVARRLVTRSGRTLTVRIRSGATLHIRRQRGTNRVVLTPADGWRQKGDACLLTDAQLTACLHTLLTKGRGYVKLPCGGRRVDVTPGLSLQLHEGSRELLEACRR